MALESSTRRRWSACWRACANWRARCPSGTPINLVEVLRWPGVIRDDSVGGEELLAAARTLFAETVDDLVAARAREGARLRELIEQRCSGLEALVAQVRARLPEVQARIRARLARAARGAEGAGRPGAARAGARDAAAAAGRR